MAGAKPSLRAGLLLQGRGGERRRWIAPRRLCLDIGDGEGRVFQRVLEIVGLHDRADIEPLELLSVGADETCFETFIARRLKLGEDRPVFLGAEFLDFQFAVADKSQRDRLHAAGRAGAGELAPEHGRQSEADEIIECAAGKIGIDQRVVDLARMLHRLGHRLLGDGVEDDALDRLVLQRLLFIERFEHVPGDRLALAVGVGGEDQRVGLLEGMGDVVDPLLRLRIDLPEHLEIIVRVDRSVLGRQVADMAKRRQHLVTGSKIFVDRLRFGRQLDNDNFHEIPMGYPQTTQRIGAESATCSGRNMGKEPPAVKSGRFSGL